MRLLGGHRSSVELILPCKVRQLTKRHANNACERGENQKSTGKLSIDKINRRPFLSSQMGKKNHKKAAPKDQSEREKKKRTKNIQIPEIQ